MKPITLQNLSTVELREIIKKGFDRDGLIFSDGMIDTDYGSVVDSVVETLGGFLDE